MASTQQMIFRIDSELKRLGDEVFARYGYTPSEAVRRIYELAVRGDDESVILFDSIFLANAPDQEKQEEQQRREHIRQFQADHGALLKRLGLSKATVPDVSLSELQEYIAQSRLNAMAEGGLA